MINAFAGQKRKKTIFDDDSDDDGTSKDSNNNDNGSNGAVEITTLGGLDFPESQPQPQQSDEPSPKRRASEKSFNKTSQRPPRSNTGTPKDHVNLSSLHSSNKHAQEAASIDPSIYDYDAIYDSLHPPRQSSSSTADPDAQGPKYMKSLLRSAEVRKRDQLRARDRMLQREREAEGDEFADKEKFVTAAYKAQQEEARRLEAEEAEREREEEEKRKKGVGMVSFYKDVLERDGRRHEEAMKAAEEAVRRKKEGKEDEEGEKEDEKSAAQIATELNAKGANIVINDEGEVVDKRQLLSAGLNVSKKAKAKPAPAADTSGSRYGAGRASDRSGIGGAGRASQRARQTEMLAAQLEERMRKEQEEEEARLKELAEKNKSKRSETDVMSAKERYLARKREREKEKSQGK